LAAGAGVAVTFFGLRFWESTAWSRSATVFTSSGFIIPCLRAVTSDCISLKISLTKGTIPKETGLGFETANHGQI
jgi:hypothetical protein